MKPIPNQKIVELISSKNMENVLLAFELADAANCPYLKSFKRKYFKSENPRITSRAFRVKMTKLFNHIAGKKMRFSVVAKAFTSGIIDIFPKPAKLQTTGLMKFKSVSNHRINCNKTTLQWAIIEQHRVMTEHMIYLRSTKMDENDIPF